MHIKVDSNSTGSYIQKIQYTLQSEFRSRYKTHRLLFGNKQVKVVNLKRWNKSITH